MRCVLLVVMTATTAMAAEGRWSAVDSSPRGAIETRPIWERPAMGLSLQREAEAAMDRGNGRIEDAATFELRRIDVARGLARDASGATRGAGAGAFELMQMEWERQRQLDLARVKRADVERREKIVEIESERLAAERERWMKQMAKPRHAEAAVVERQTGEKR